MKVVKLMFLLLAVVVLSGPAMAITKDAAVQMEIQADMADAAEGNNLCPISGEPVDSMGGAYEVEHNGQKVKLCCKMCAKEFKKDPEGYLKKIQEAEAAADDHAGHQH